MRLTPTFCFYNDYWTHSNDKNLNCYICGWAEYKGAVLFGQTLLNLVKTLDFRNDVLFKSFITELNGNFSIILSNAVKTILAVDRMRMFPILYFIKNEKIVITDNINSYRKECDTLFTFNPITLEQYFFSDYVFGPFTIFKDVYSIQSGEFISISHDDFSILRNQYFKWEPKIQEDDFDRNYQDEAKQQDEIFQSVFKRMLNSAQQVNNWIVPLSGGYDSRTIVNYLHKLGVYNVICFSYGIENNIQSEISQRVADALGYKWYFIDYSVWINKIKNTGLINDFLLQAFNGTSVAHLQDFTAVYALKEMGVLQNGDIFVPGHALEVLAGNHLDQRMKLCNDTKSALSIIKRHYSSFGYADKKRINVHNHVETIINNYGVNSDQLAEIFDWKERQTKYIAYSVKVYEFFGYDWRIPEWDLELFKYWKSIGFNYRINRNMYKSVFKEYLCIDLLKQIPFANDILEQKKKSSKTSILDLMPLELKRIIKRLFNPKSNYYVNEGLHLVYTNSSETIEDYINSYEIPMVIKKHLLKYPKRQKLSTLPVNSVSTLLIIRSCHRA